MFALHSDRLRRRLSAPTSGSARRRARERRRAEQTRLEGERLARERREQRQREKFELQKKVHRELASYEPWGRAGGGAPNPRGIRFTNLRAVGIYPEDELKGVSAHELNRRWSLFRRRQRGRTPLRLREDPQLCYAELLRQTVDNDIRYRQTPREQQAYKQILDDMVVKRQKALDEEIRRDMEYERKMQTMDGPWGKPGPGGAIWRNPRDIGLNFSKSMGWTDNEIFDKMKGEHKRYKRSSLFLPKVKTADDESKHDVNNKENVKPSSVEKLPDIGKQTSPEVSPEGRRKSDESKEVKPVKNGKTKRSPKKNVFVKRLSNGERVRKTLPDDEVDNGDACGEKKPTPEATILRLTGGIELVPLLARRRRVGARTLPSSDVTRPPEQSCEWRELSVDYLRELKHQMRVKCQQKEESRRDSAESVRRHHATWASLWGRPGHGAPQLRGRYARSNLAQLLYVAPPLANAQL
ncbi:uncharacterized protein LOC123867612 [Maniola jurtina]|uniref:uncharacterized protein LOC123867612 n=1 Tax=Maniola jurtina TaxID=191418 RepID=UPI001E6878C2|nr:uncharacterized protein LOC123867612 [Maniola jurtina]